MIDNTTTPTRAACSRIDQGSVNEIDPEAPLSGIILWSNRNQSLQKEDREATELRAALQRQGIAAEIVAPEEIVIPLADDQPFPPRIIRQGQKLKCPDIVVPRLGAHTDDYAAALLKMLADFGAVCVNREAAIRLAADKFLSKLRLRQAGLPVPKGTLVRDDCVDVQAVGREIGFPCVVKRLQGSQGEGVSRIFDESQLLELVGFARIEPEPQCLLIEEYIQANGADLRVFCIGGEPVAAMQRSCPPGGWKANVSQGGSVQPVVLDEELASLAVSATRSIGLLDVAGVDLICDPVRGALVVELNSSPGWTGLQAAHPALKVADRIADYIRAQALLRGDSAARPGTFPAERAAQSLRRSRPVHDSPRSATWQKRWASPA